MNSMNDKTICIHMQTYEPHFIFTANLIDSLYTKTDIESLRINIYCFFDNQECISKFCEQFPEQSNKIHCVSLVDVVRNKLPSEIVFNDPISCLDLNNPGDELETCESVDIKWADRRRRYLNIKRSYGIIYLQHLGYDFTWCLDSESLVLENTSIKSMIEYHTDKPCLYAYPTEPGLISKTFWPADTIFEWKEHYSGIGVFHNDFWIVSNSLFRDMVTELISKYRKPVSYFMNGSELLLYECYMYHHYKTLGQDIRFVQLPKNFGSNIYIRKVIENPETDILNNAKMLNSCYFNNTLSYRGDMLKWPEFKTPRGKKLLQHLNIKIAVSNWQGDEGWKKK